MARMNDKKHKEKHILLHRYFDELLADFIMITGKAPLKLPIKELIDWSYRQTQDPEQGQSHKGEE